MEQRAGKAHTGVLTTFLKCETTTETSKQPSAAAGHRGGLVCLPKEHAVVQPASPKTSSGSFLL